MKRKFYCFLKLAIKPNVKMKKIYLILSLLLLSICCFSQSRYISATTKRIVFARDGGICQCCGSSNSLEFDHVVPYSCGGRNDASNIQLLCQKCNRSKSNSCYCKVHNKIVGINCCEGKTTKSKSDVTSIKKISSAAIQCSGVTSKGTRCKNKTTNSNGRCHLH
jgi:hypothetical protein